MVTEQFHRDTDDRPIREGRTPPELLREGEIEYRQCPYSGTRYMNKRPMNVSALRQTSAHWDEVVDALAFLREAYTQARGGYKMDVLDLWRIGQIGSALPWFYILHERATCPAYAAALSKATLGVGIWGWRVFVKLLAEGNTAMRFTSQLILDTSEETDTLVAETEVCAASDKMMLRFYDVLTSESVSVRGVGDVGPLIAARDELMRFGAFYIAFKQWVWLHWLARRALYEELQVVLGPRPELVERMDPTGEPPDFFPLTTPHQLHLAGRAQWFAGLAMLIEPFAPDGSDKVMRLHAIALAALMGREPDRVDAIAAEVAQVAGLDAEASVKVARVLGTYAAIDALHADVMTSVEAGFRGEPSAVFDAAARDRVIRMSPREMFTKLAPTELTAILRP
jgi:hypothetical protein